MGYKWTQFPDELDTSALQLAYDLWLGKPVDKPTAALAISNLIGFGEGRLIGQPIAAASQSDSYGAKVFEDAIGHAKTDVNAAASRIDWTKILPMLVTLLLQLLSK